ncbi:acetylserotonin O-methyltransferase-like [Ptychodera flava]|uniref:acetylserotonin O-methyltransferase-like n=1 Tax=Ptychodera flava TaxID=63121 RepID=UPI00396A12BC
MDKAEAVDKDETVFLFDLITGFQKSKVLFTACELGVFDILAKDDKSKTAVQLANEMSTDADATERFLNACVSLGLLKKSWDNDQNALYANTEMATKHLSSGADSSLKGLMQFVNRTTWPLMTNLEHAVREGKDQRRRAFGADGEKLYERVYSDEKSTLNFLGGMHGFAMMAAKAVARAFDLSEFGTVCDFGGGSGALANELSLVYPGMSVTVLDLPPVVNASKHFLPKDTAERKVRFLAGDFFVDDLPKADLYVFSLIFHNWSDTKIQQLLGKLHKVMKPGDAVLVAEHLFNDEKTGPPEAAMRCMMMLAGTEGRERSAKEYSRILEASGFGNIKIERTGSFQEVIMARRL